MTYISGEAVINTTVHILTKEETKTFNSLQISKAWQGLSSEAMSQRKHLILWEHRAGRERESHGWTHYTSSHCSETVGNYSIACSTTERGLSTDTSLRQPPALTSLGLWLPSVKWIQQCPSPRSKKSLFDFAITVICVSGAALFHSQMTSRSLRTAITTKQQYQESISMQKD